MILAIKIRGCTAVNVQIDVREVQDYAVVITMLLEQQWI